MSIIHNALKKAQKELEKTETKKTTPPPAPEKPKKTSAPSQPAQFPNGESQSSFGIYDKLRSGQAKPKPKPAAQAKAKPSAKQTKTETQQKKKSPALKTVIILLFIILIAGALLFVGFSMVKDTPFVQEKLAAMKRPKPAPERVYKEGEFVLNGTMMMGNKQVALINGDVYEVGENVGNKKVVRITLKEVELLEDGEIITLRTK